MTDVADGHVSDRPAPWLWRSNATGAHEPLDLTSTSTLLLRQPLRALRLPRNQHNASPIGGYVEQRLQRTFWERQQPQVEGVASRDHP
jgi:hypothetical protein